jgi:hypothetical protein
MDRIKILDDALWQTVSPEVIKEAEQSARAEPSWIVCQSNTISWLSKTGQAVPTPLPAT